MKQVHSPETSAGPKPGAEEDREKNIQIGDEVSVQIDYVRDVAPVIATGRIVEASATAVWLKSGNFDIIIPYSQVRRISITKVRA